MQELISADPEDVGERCCEQGLVVCRTRPLPQDLLPRLGGRRWLVSAALGVLIVCLLYFSLRQVHFSGIWDQLRSLRPWQILAVSWPSTY